MTVYAFGNGYLLFGMFQAIVLFFKNNNIGVLFTILAMIAAIYYAIRVTIYHKHSLISTAKYVIVFSIVLTGLVYNQTTVIVNDVSNPASVTNAQPISDVPWGIAALWSGFTTIQYGLATDFTNDFSTPAGDNMLSEGLGVSIIQQADSATISTSNSYLYQDYNEYISNCVAPGISAGFLNVSQLLAAGDATDAASQTYSANAANGIWAVMSAYTSGLGANLLTDWYSGASATSVTEEASGQSDPGGITTTCSNETTWLNLAVNSYITNDAGPAIAGGLQMASFSDLSNAIGAINPYIYNMQQGGQAQLMQAIGVNMYAPAILKMAQASGSNASSLAVATGEATASTQAGQFLQGILAGKYMPIVFGLFEAILLGVSVIIFILLLTHMGVSYLKLLFQLMIMITIWPSLTAIFNYITQLIIQAQYQPISGIGYSVSGSGTINTFLTGSLSWMGYLSWSVPMMAYAMASGSSYAMASMVAGLSGSLRTDSAGQALAKGDFRAGDVSTNNMNSNKFDVTQTQRTGWAPSVRREGFTKISTANGIADIQKNIPGISDSAALTEAGIGTFNDHALGLNQSFQNGQLTSIAGSAISANQTQSIISGFSKNLTSAESQSKTAATTFNSAVSGSKNLSNSIGSNLTGSQKQIYDAAVAKNFDYIVDRATGLSAAQQDSLKTQFNAGIAAGESPISAGFSAISSTDFSGTLKASLDDKFANILKTSFSKKGELSYVASGSQGTQFVGSLNDVITTGKSYQAADSAVKTAQSQLNFAEQNQTAVTESAMFQYFKNFDAKNGAGMNIEQLKNLNEQEYQSLLNNSEPLKNFAAENPEFLKSLNKIDAGAAKIPAPNASAAKNKIVQFYDKNKPVYVPLTGTPTPALVKSQIATMNTKPAPLITQASGGSVTPEGFNSYFAGDVSNFLKTGAEDLVRLTHFKGPSKWSPTSWRPEAPTVTNVVSVPNNLTNQKIEAFNARLANEKIKINSSILPGSNGAAGSYLNAYNNSALVGAGAAVTKSVNNLGLNPAPLVKPPNDNKILPGSGGNVKPPEDKFPEAK